MDSESASEQSRPDETQHAIRMAGQLIRRAKNGLALTGAGISTPSGIPDFRSSNSGLWTKYDPMEVASLSAFRYHPDKFFTWIRPLAELIVDAQPNPAHYALADLEAAGFINTIITQNIDNLHQRAGSGNVLEVHGTMETLTCVGCYRIVEASTVVRPFLESGNIPHCPFCSRILKPNVVLFEEQLPIQTWLKAKTAVEACDLLIVAGSSLEVTPVAGLPIRVLERNMPLILVNYTHTYIDRRATVVIHDDLAKILPLIVEEALGARA